MIGRHKDKGMTEMGDIGKRTGRKLLSLLAVCMLILSMSMTVRADEAYYATWKEYQASGQPSGTWNDVANAMDKVIDKGKELYAQGDSKGAYDCINHGYYGYYETTGFERLAMGYISGSRKTEMELQFAACKAVAKNGGPEEDFNREADKLSEMLHTDADVLDGKSSGSDADHQESAENAQMQNAGGTQRSAAAAAFIACFSIILREGFEAILIVGTIIAYLVKTAGDDEERKRKLVRPVYIGSLLGIAVSFVLAWLLNAIKLANSASQEIIEGVTALTAVVVLYYVSNWMLSKSESEAWTKYIRSKAEQSSAKNSMLALAITAFLAVFREGAEVVLFFQPMLAGGNIHMVWTGLIVGAFCLVVVYLAIRYMSLRIPMRPFFTGTSILMFLMSVSFLGAGIKELIEGDVLAMTSPEWLSWIPSNDFMDVLGIYPILETLIPQLLLLAVSVGIFIRQSKKNKAIRLKAEAREAEERAAREAAEKKAREEELRALVREVVKEVLAEQKGAPDGESK